MAIHKRRTRTSHPGVKIKLRRYREGDPKWRDGGESWRAVWIDPDTGRECQESLSKLGLTSSEARTTWAVAKSRANQMRLAELASGAPILTRTGLEKAVDDYFVRITREVRPKTVAKYRNGTSKFVLWAKKSGIAEIEKLTAQQLAKFRAYLAALPARRPRKGSRRGAREDRGAPRPATLNADLRGIKTMLNEVRRLGLLPRLDRDAISDNLRPFKTERPRPSHMRPPEIRRLLEAALRHDEDCFEMTREEKANGVQPGLGVTARHEAIAPLVLATLMTGCRIGELLTLPWDGVDLDADNGAGEIVLDAAATKTNQERAIPLDCCPSLRALLAAVRIQAGRNQYVFGDVNKAMPWHAASQAAKRLRRTYGAPPKFTWKLLRSTCSTYLVNAGIYGPATVWYAAKRTGHSVTIMERHYAGLMKLPPAKTLETAMGIADLVAMIVRGALGETVTPPALALAE